MDLEEELNRIRDEEIRKLTKECLDGAPSWFWIRPASSTGKYHSSDENITGGLILHTKRVCKIAEILIEAWMVPINADVIRSACILHDIAKYGLGIYSTKYTLPNHPQLGGEFIKKIAGDKYKEKVENISNAITSHMGKWGFSFENNPENLIVHLADVIATSIYQEE